MEIMIAMSRRRQNVRGKATAAAAAPSCALKSVGQGERGNKIGNIYFRHAEAYMLLHIKS